MLGALKSLDLKSSKMYVGEALEVAINWRGKIGGKSNIPFDIFSSFLNDACHEFKKDRNTEVDIVSLAYTFSEFSRPFSNEVQKVLEYLRICLSWKHDDRNGEARKNILNYLAELGL